MSLQKADDEVLSLAKSKSLQAEVLGVESTNTKVSFSQRKLDQFSLSTTHQIGVRVVDGFHEGMAYSESLEPESLRVVLDQAAANARRIEHSYASELNCPEKAAQLNGLWIPTLADVDMDVKLKAAEVLEATALDMDAKITAVPWSGYVDSLSEVWVGNTKGFFSTYRKGSAAVFASCLAQAGEDNAMFGEGQNNRDFSKLKPEAVAKIAAERTLRRLGAKRPDTGRYTVIFEHRAAEELIGLITDYFSSKAVSEGSSPLAGRLGQNVFSNTLTLVDDPHLIAGSGARPMDAEGFGTRQTTLVEQGRLKTFLTNSVYAKKMKLKHTASASRSPASDLGVSVSNLTVRPGTKAFKDLLDADKKVIVITSLEGSAGFRATSGDFSLPVIGDLFEGGSYQVALKDFLVAGNILELLGQVEAVGNDVQPPVGSVSCPSLLIRNVNVSGQA